MPEREILTIRDVAKHLQVSERTVYDWAQKGEIPCGKLGNSWRFKRVEVERWLDRKLLDERESRKTSAIAVKDVLTRDRVLFLDTNRKKTVLNAMIDCLAQMSELEDREELASEIFHREELMSTGIGLGVAIPHVRLASLDKVVMAAAVMRDGVKDYESIDSQPVQLVFMIAAGHHQHAEYLKLLSGLANLVKNEDARHRLIGIADPDDFYSTLCGAR